MTNPYSYQVKPSVEIHAPTKYIWDFLVNVEDWWVKSNPEHKSLTVDNFEKNFGFGTKLTIREKIAGIPCKAIGEVTKYEVNDQVIWEATYFMLGLKWIGIPAGVKWQINSVNKDTNILIAHVWANFPQTLSYKFLWFFFKNIMNGIKKDYDHAMKELIYIKTAIEQNEKSGKSK